MKKIIIQNGIYSGLANAGFMGVSMAYLHISEKYEGNIWLGYTAMIIAYLFIYFGIKQFRNLINNGKINFIQGFKIGLGISLIASMFYVITWAMIYHFYMPEFFDKVVEGSINKLKLENLPLAQFELKEKEILSYKAMYQNPAYFFLFTFLEIFPVGALSSMIYALILKKK
jgi:hypothetical protein